MSTLSFHDKPSFWQNFLKPAARKRRAVNYSVYSHDSAGHWKKHDLFSSPAEAMDFARHLAGVEGVMRIEIKKSVRDPETGQQIELDFKILS